MKYNTDLYRDTNICSSKSLKKQVLALISDAELEKLPNLTTNYKFKFIDLFAGIGGIRLGAERNGGLCVFSSEFDKFAQQTYQLNHHEMPFGDITQIDANNLPSHDLLLAGFPCQPFSYSGKTEGFEDKTRGTLFFDVLRILENKQPKFALLENVKGFK
ncbi:DNA (cytosine-5-)-methyltransferase, partial [Moraxella catarrhalis]|uniref:DNA (cytosine-5-)-methyltransferase n=1 Tax=Moraxella catarrhalis TaxID=480 RepID=UPI003F68D5AB|nr:DNA (cytosine-5-)-methyltransferase [Moraxella catarrhalis]